MHGMFGPHPGYVRARIYPRNFWYPAPKDRPMAPDGNIYYPSQEYQDDFSSPAVSVIFRARFMHEATHLYQWYVLRQWVWIGGPFDRQYDYELYTRKNLQDYGLEQMGSIVEDYYRLINGARGRGKPYKIADFASVLPVHGR